MFTWHANSQLKRAIVLLKLAGAAESLQETPGIRKNQKGCRLITRNVGAKGTPSSQYTSRRARGHNNLDHPNCRLPTPLPAGKINIAPLNWAMKRLDDAQPPAPKRRIPASARDMRRDRKPDLQTHRAPRTPHRRAQETALRHVRNKRRNRPLCPAAVWVHQTVQTLRQPEHGGQSAL